MTDEVCYSQPIEFQSAAPVLPNGSYAVPLNTVEDANSDCHLNLNETDGTLTGTANSSNSGNFLVNVQCVFFRPSPNVHQISDLQDREPFHRVYTDLEDNQI